MKLFAVVSKLVFIAGLLVVQVVPIETPALAATSVFVPVADAYVSSASRTSNFGTRPTLEVENGKQARVAYLKFNTSGLQSPLNSATLQLRADTADTCTSGVGVEIYRGGSSTWTETGITWKNQPGSTGARLAAADGYASGSTLSLDVTAAIPVAPTAVTLVLKMPLCGTALNRFGSRESVNKPQLVIDSGDSVVPSVAITNPAEGETVGPSPNATGTAQDNVAVRRVDVAVDGAAWTPATCTGCGSTSASWTVTLKGLAPGSHVITARAVDGADNVSGTTARSFNVVDASPTIRMNTPDQDGVELQPNASVQGTATDDDAVARVEVSFDNGGWLTADCSGCGTGSATWSQSIAGLSAGPHTVSARSVDSAGNLSDVVSRTFSVAEPAPPPPPGACDGVHLNEGDDLVAAINGTTNTTFCVHSGTYDLGNSSLRPGTGDKVIGDDIRVSGPGAIDAPTKIVGRSPNGVFDFNVPTTNVVLENLDISGATGDATCKPMCGRGINGHSGNATSLTIRNSRIHHNASNGVGGAKQALLENVELDNNGATAFLGCCSAGVKSVHPYTIRGSYVHHNIGNGVWQDVCGADFVVINNTITYNSRSGVRYEHNQDCPGNATIEYNVIQNNNTEGLTTDVAGVTVNSAPNAEIAFNTFGNNSPGVAVGGARGPYTGTYIHDNTMNGDEIVSCSLTGVLCENNL